jgi:hypothetical protein
MSDFEVFRQVAAHTNSVGLLVDRAVRGEQTIGTVFMVDENTVATCAHLTVLYTEFMPALKVKFPVSKAEYAVSNVRFHTKFDQQPAYEMARRALKDPVAALALQDFNVGLLTLSKQFAPIEGERKTSFNQKLSLEPLPRVQGLNGSVEELGLALIIQTVSQSRKDGVLYITDERNRPMARIFFHDGKIQHAKFGQLHNEFAIYQMFQQPMSGQFFLKTQSEPDWQTNLPPLQKPTDMFLLEAHRRLDESAKLFEKLGGSQMGYVARGDALRTDGLSPEAAKFADRIWACLDGGVTISELYDVVGLDSYTVLSTLVELFSSNQVGPVNLPPPPTVAPAPLELAAYESLSKWDELISLTAHHDSGRAQMRSGSLVGMLQPNDPYHLLHTLRLPYQSAGCPIFKRGKVIGMHCGMLPLDPALHALPNHLHQMMWVEAIRLCMNEAGAAPKASIAHKPSVGMIRPDFNAASSKLCPKCQAIMVQEAMFCGTCGAAL